MSVSILEALQNAEHNLATGHPVVAKMAKSQLHNAVVLLEKGYNPNTLVEPLLAEHGTVEDVPDLEE